MRFLMKFRQAFALTAALMLTGSLTVFAAQTQTSEAVWYAEDRALVRSLTVTPLYTVEDGLLTAGFAGLPEDVTAEYAGNELYGIPAGAERGRAFQITLRDDVFREDGTAVNAEDLVLTLQTRLEDYLWISNAEEYLQGAERPAENIISLNDAGFDSVSDGRSAGYTRFYVDLENFWGLEAGWESVESRSRIMDYAMPAGLDELYVTPAYLYRNYLEEGTPLSHLQGQFVGVAEAAQPLMLEDVGILQTGEKEIVIITEEAFAAQTVATRLADLLLEGEGSYGPYRIAAENADEILLERNPCWQGNSSEYPADVIRCLTP